MNKISIALIIISVLALLITGCTAEVMPPVTNEPAKEVVETQTSVQTPLENINGISIGFPAECGVYFKDPALSTDTATMKIHLDGTLLEKGTNNPIGDADVKAYCGGTEIASAKTVSDGSFLIIANPDSCAEGSIAMLVVEYNGGSCNSMGLEVLSFAEPNYPVGPSGDAPITPLFMQNTPISGVPEFPAFGLVLAVLIGGLGLAYMRKQ